MSKRVGGFINQDGLNAPDPATGVSASAGDAQADVSFTAPADVGGSAITGFVATSDDGIGATGPSSPITVSGLSNGTAYTFRVWALNAFGYSSPSDASGSVSPFASYGIIFGGYAGSSAFNTIQYVSISSEGNASDFGDLSFAWFSSASTSSFTRALVGGGYNASDARINNIEYVTVASAGNSTDFGDLTAGTNSLSGGGDAISGFAIGGYDTAQTNKIEKFTFATTGNATDFGDLVTAVTLASNSASSAHGGLS